MHRWSKLFIPTLREAPADAEVASHKFLVRAGYIRQLGAGIYSYLFLGQRSIDRIIGIVREEMDRIGQEFLLPTIHPADLWRESGRWTLMGDNMFRLKDRKGADLCLGMTHEEVMTDIARNELRSYKQLPQIWYQIQTKFRDEPRPKAGLLRVRQFIMKDSYSFDLDPAGLDRSYDLHDAAYRAIFTRCGLKFVAVEAHSGAMGGSQSQEFMVYTDAGEDQIASCAACDYAANMEKATSRLAPVKEMAPTGDGKPELVATPGQASIVDVTKFFDIEASSDIKCVAYMATFSGAHGVSKAPIIAFLRGDHAVNESKLLSLLSANSLQFMDSGEILNTFVSKASESPKGLYESHALKTLSAPAGYLGPIGLKPLEVQDLESLRRLGSLPERFPFKEEPVYGGLDSATIRVYFDPIVVLDLGLDNRQNLVCGANKLDYHYRNVVPGRDFSWTTVADIRDVLPGEGCPQCGKPLIVAKAVEVGHIFKLGDRYTDKMGVRVLDANGREVTPIMGCYGIGIERILTAAIEQSNDANGFWLPRSIAPFDVVVTVTNVTDAALKAAGETIASELETAGFDVLFDDRDERAGVKFKDADLIGIPYRITVGKKAAEGKVELVTRASASGRDVAIGEVAAELQRSVSVS